MEAKPLTLDLWITEDGWSVETVDGDRLAGGRLSDSSQTRASLNAQLRESGYEIVEVDDDE